MSSSYAYFDQSYGARTPYITTTEYINAPTAMDYSNLIPGGNAAAQLISLQETINRASSWIDSYTCGAWGTLCATVEQENARVWGSYRGTLLVHPKYWPVVEVQSFAYSDLPGGLISAKSNSTTVNPSTSIFVYPQQFEVVQQGVVNMGLAAKSGIERRFEYDCEWTYVCGWPNTTLAASVAAGSASITPSVVTGFYPNTPMTLYDLPFDEPIKVASHYVAGGSVVPLVSPLQYDHPMTATVTNLPPAIKQAAILATTAFIKQRGSGALIAADIGDLTSTQVGFAQNAGEDWMQVRSILEPFKVKYVGW